MKKHNGVIGLWKFIFCIVIAIFHAGEGIKTSFFTNGHLGVEFFFLVSGYLLAKSAVSRKDKVSKKDEQNLGKETGLFIFKKYKSFFPYIFLTFIVSFIIKIVLGKMTIKLALFSVFDLFCLNMLGYQRSGIFNQIWYISAMLLCMALIYPQIRKFKDNYFHYIGPLSAIVIAGIYYHYFKDLHGPTKWIGLTYTGVVRAYFELSIGALIYPLVQKIKETDFTKLGIYTLTAIEIFGFIIATLAMNYVSRTYDYIVLIILARSVLVAFSEKTLDFKILNNKFVYFLEKLSLPVYLISIPFRNCFNTIGLSYKEHLILLLFVSLILGTIMVLIVDYLKKREFYIPKIKKLFIKTT